MAYSIYRTDLFEKQLRNLCKKDKPLEKLLLGVINDIASHPENFASSLKAERNRSVKKKAVKERYRIVYRFCERCFVVHKDMCDGCEMNGNNPPTIITLEEVFRRDDGY
jgi:mRNA-degrading endonuclease RelE of RelBE toxin-antitoxin system